MSKTKYYDVYDENKKIMSNAGINKIAEKLGYTVKYIREMCSEGRAIQKRYRIVELEDTKGENTRVPADILKEWDRVTKMFRKLKGANA